MEQNNRKKTIICISASIASILTLLILFVCLWRIPTPKEIYNKSENFVVELKSSTNDNSRESYGSAVFVKKDGTLVTNAHMVTYKESGVYHPYDKLEIRFAYEDNYHSTSLLKYDLQEDIAVIKLASTENIKFKVAHYSTNNKVRKGDTVYAVGNGLNHGLGITEGIVSIDNVNITYNEYTRKVIQCDLIINDGNSGGALLDKRGNLIGITTFRLKDDNGIIIYGLAFSLPINNVMNYVNA